MAVAKPISPSPGRKILCQVCGAWSSGLHFGVFTCEGCKCFYRRSIREGANYACAKDRGCEITMETRNSCRYCRFNKCLRLGMSKEGIKLGRRPKVECDPGMHQVYLRNDDPIKPPTMPPTSGLSYHQWPHMMGSSPTSGTIQIKTEISDACGIFGATPPPYRPPFSIKKEPGEVNYATGYHCQMNGHAVTPNRPGLHTPETEAWSGHGVAPWKCGDVRGHYSNPYIDNSSRISQCRPVAAWTPVQASPDSSGKLSAEPVQWDAAGNGPTPLNIPDVQTGAIAAMAFANLYRDTNVGPGQAVSDTSGPETTGVRNNNSPRAGIGEDDQKSYIELMPRNRPEKRVDRSGPNEISEVKGQLQITQQCGTTHMLAPAMIGSSAMNATQAICTATTKRALEKDDSPLTTKKSRLIRGERKTPAAASSGITELLCGLTKAYNQMQTGVMELYKGHQRNKPGVVHSPTTQFNQILGSNELSERFCKQEKDGLKHTIQTFVKFLRAKNPNWIPVNSSDQIPLAFITKICLLTEFSQVSEGPRSGEEAHISADEAACLVALSLIYDKNPRKDTHSDKQQITNDLREELKRKGFGSHKLQRLLEQQELNMSSLETG